MVVKEEFYVGYSEIDRSLRIRNTSILKIFENMACIHGSLAGDSIKNSDARWFLTAYRVKILKRPEYEERVTAHTWSRDIKGISAVREFEIYSEDGEKCVIGISNWARVNAITQKLERASAKTVEAYQSEIEHTNFGELKLPKLKECESYEYTKDFLVDRNFIDTNRHMNNVCYMELAELVVPEEVYDAGCDEFEIMYKKAIKYGEKVKCCFGKTEDAYIIAVKSEDLSELFAIIKMYM